MNFLLIGKPNVGKSSIFNILTSGKKNIIHKKEGTTRDWHINVIKGLENIYLYDTPGLIINDKKIDNLKLDVIQNKIDTFLYVVDNKTSQNNTEIEPINKLRKFNFKFAKWFNLLILFSKEPAFPCKKSNVFEFKFFL